MDTEIELLKHIHKDALMGSEATMTLLKAILNTDNKIKEDVEEIANSYKEFVRKSEKLLVGRIPKLPKPNIMTKMSANMGVKMEINKDNSDARIADMLIKGLTMGEIEISKRIGSFDEITEKEILDLATEFKDFQGKAILKLKKFL